MEKYFSLFLVLAVFLIHLNGCAGLLNKTHRIDPGRMAQIGYQLQQNPGQEEQILAQHGLSQQEFTEKMHEISRDSQLSQQYRDEFYRLMEEE